MSGTAGPSGTQDPTGVGVNLPTASGKQELRLTTREISDKMAAVSDKAISALVKVSVEIEVSTLDITIFDIFAFQGFDPDAIIRKLIMVKDHFGLSEDQLKLDIMYMIAANIYMGNLSGKSLVRRSQDGRNMNDALAARYQIRIGSTSTGLPSDVITYPRVAGSFPVLSCKMATRLPTKDFVGMPFKSVNVPKFMRLNAFASLCGKELKEQTRLFLLKSTAAYSCDQSIVFERGRRQKQGMKGKDLEPDNKEIAAGQWTFIWAAAESGKPDRQTRVGALMFFNVIGMYSILEPVVTNYNAIMDDTTHMPTQEEFESDLTAYFTMTDLKPGSQSLI